MANGTPDFRFRSQLDVPGIADLLARKTQREETLRIQKEQNQQNQINSLLNAVQLGSSLASEGIARSAAKQELQARRNLSEAVENFGRIQQQGEFVARTELPTEGPLTQAGEPPQPATDFQRLADTPGFQKQLGAAQTRLASAAAQASPQVFAARIAEQQFKDPLDRALKEVQVSNALFGKKRTEKEAQDLVLKLSDGVSKKEEVKDATQVEGNVASMDSLLTEALSGNFENKIALEQALVTMFNKVTDPGSVVRESEFARTPANAPIINRFEGALRKLKEGGVGLTDADRVALVKGAKIIANEKFKVANRSINATRKAANKLGLDVDLLETIRPAFKPFKIDRINKKKTGKNTFNGKRIIGRRKVSD